MSNYNIQTVEFHGQNIPTIFHNEKHYVGMKAICENIGLQWEAQYKRIKRHPVLSQGMSMMDIPSKGGIQRMLCLPLEMLNGWLFGIETNRVKAEIRDTLIQYQRECFGVLFKYFHKPVEQPKLEDLSTVESRVPLKDAVNRLVATKKVPYNVAWKMVHQREGVSKAKEMTEAQAQDALQYVHELTLSNVIEGELLLKDKTPKLPELPTGHANIAFNMQKNADYTVRVREGKASRKQLLYCIDPRDEKQDWWLEA